MTTKKFNLEMARNGKAIQTKLGNPARIITITNDNKLYVEIMYRYIVKGSFEKVIAPVLEPMTEKYCLDGRKYSNTDTNYDLEMVEAYEVAA